MEQLVKLKADCLVTIVSGSDVVVTGTERGQDFLDQHQDMEMAFVNFCNGMYI